MTEEQNIEFEATHDLIREACYNTLKSIGKIKREDYMRQYEPIVSQLEADLGPRIVCGVHWCDNQAEFLDWDAIGKASITDQFLWNFLQNIRPHHSRYRMSGDIRGGRWQNIKDKIDAIDMVISYAAQHQQKLKEAK